MRKPVLWDSEAFRITKTIAQVGTGAVEAYQDSEGKMSIRRRSSVHEDDTQVLHHDEGKLAELGYKQELNRSWSMLHNFGVSFSIIVSVTPNMSERAGQSLMRACRASLRALRPYSALG